METHYKLKIALPVAIVLVVGALISVWYFTQKADREDRDWILSMLPPPPENGAMEGRLLYAVQGAFRQIDESSDAVQGTARLAQLYQANGYLNEAVQCLDLLLQLDPENPLWPHLLAFILAGYGELEPAMTLWKTVMELAPDYLPTHLRRAEALLKLNRIEDAEAAFTIVKIKDIKNPHAYHGLARVAIHRNDYKTARGHLTKSLQYSDGSVGIQLMVTVLERLDEQDRANIIRGMSRTLEGYSDIPDPWLNDLLDFCYDPHQLITAAGVAEFAGNLEDAMKLAQLAIKYDPDYASAYFQMGNILNGQKQIREALSNYEIACSLNPRLSDAWLFRALIYLEMGSDEQCDELLSKGLAHNPDSPALHLSWGEQLVKKGRLDEAIPILKRSIKLRPQEPEAYIVLSRIYLRQENLEKAREAILEALEAEAANPTALSIIAVLCINLGRKEEAQMWIDKIDLQPRITDDIRQDLAGFFEKAFGHPPE